MKASSFIFLPNYVSFVGELPYKLTDKYTLRRANSEQVGRIKEMIDKTLSPFIHSIPHYDQTVGGSTPKESEWLYWVITYDDVDTTDKTLEFALTLLRHGLHFAFTFTDLEVPSHKIIQWHSSTLLQYFEGTQKFLNKGPFTILTSELSEVGRYFKLIDKAEVQKASVFSAISEFWELQALPYTSNFQVLGCFAVIESLLTHNPNDKEVGDSLTHQLKTKLALLEKMFERPLDFSPFGSTAKEKVWTALYSFRSAIAHGVRFEFEKKFPALKSRETALDFLREVTKLVILIALEKRDFIEDLKAV